MIRLANAVIVITVAAACLVVAAIMLGALVSYLQ